MDTKSGLTMPTTNATPGSSSAAIEGIRKKTLDAWNKFGNQAASEEEEGAVTSSNGNSPKQIRVKTNIKGHDQHPCAISLREKIVKKIEAYPWNEWEQEYLTRRNPDGTWFYKGLEHFAKQKKIPYEHLRIVCSSYPRDGYPYRGDWNSLRSGLRWQDTARQVANTIANVDYQTKLMALGEYSLEKWQQWVNFAARVGEEVEAWFQGQALLANKFYPTEFESDRQRRKIQLQQNKEQLERFNTYLTLMERVQKMTRVALDGYNRTLLAMSTKITIHQEKSEEPTQAALPMAPEDAMAMKFFSGYKELSDNYNLEIPGLNEADWRKAIDVEAKPVTGSPIPEVQPVTCEQRGRKLSATR